MTVCYSLHGIRFSIDADGRIADEIAAAIMPACVRRRGGARTFAVRRESGRWSVYRGRRLLWRASSVSELIPWLESEVVCWLLKGLGRYIQLHAAAVQRGGRALLVVGGPDSGKTSLACGLALSGWGVMSDEVALIERHGPTVASFPRAMLVKTATVRRLPELRRFKPRRVLLDGGPKLVRYVSPQSIGGRVRKEAGICALAFPRWSRKTSVEPIGEREALEQLLRGLLDADRHPKLSLDTCVGLVRGARLLRVHIGRLREAARQLSEAFGARR